MINWEEEAGGGMKRSLFPANTDNATTETEVVVISDILHLLLLLLQYKFKF